MCIRDSKVLAVVAEVTGYPEDMLALELDLEADLGVDTVKQAEVFATIRETFGIERDENLKLRDYPTLEAVIGFVRDRAGIPAPSAAPAAAPAVPVQSSAPAPAPTSVPAAPVADSVTETVLSVVAEVTGYPQDMLDLELDLEADLGVDTVKQAEVFATIRETFGIERDENLKLRDYPTLAAVIGFVRDRAGIPAPSAAVSDGATAAPTAQPWATRCWSGLCRLLDPWRRRRHQPRWRPRTRSWPCLLYTSDAADEEDSVDLGGRR